MSQYTRNQGDFEVKVRSKERIIPKKQTTLNQNQLGLSNLDLILPSEDVGIFLCYKRPNDSIAWSFDKMILTLKDALSQALVFYHVFSGELTGNSSGQPEILRNDVECGVEFVEAEADVELTYLDLYNPQESVKGKLVPVNKLDGLLSVQVTELKCGGIIVGCAFSHRVADAYSINMFLISWSELAFSNIISTVPSFTSSLLSPRTPPPPLEKTSSIDQMYTLISSLLPAEQGSLTSSNNNPLVSRMYAISLEEINRIQSLAKSSKLQSFGAFMWKMVSKHAVSMISKDNNEDNNDRICKMGSVVDGRTRLGSGKMISYFGNVLSIPFGEKTIRELSEKPLSWIGGEIDKYLKKAVNKEHFRDLIDWIEAHISEPALAKIYCSGRDNDDGPAFVVSSGLNFVFSKVEFGWGKPLFGSFQFPWNGNAGYVMPMPNAQTGGWVVYMHLTQPQLDFIEIEASHVFTRFKLS